MKEVCNDSRFTQVNYDKETGEKQWKLRQKFLKIEKFVKDNWESPRRDGLGLVEFESLNNQLLQDYAGRCAGLGYSALESAKIAFVQKDSFDVCLLALEGAYLWYGKTVRDEAIAKGCPQIQ